ncbi:hypothetical protein GCM10007853_14150 [Algimonas ampicilliniresistens]|jgi:hypothetical protein|uniref:Uncharacterized protein n=1 Tax=Algimonas ampicilliniresistens TaxID=1298735 RepID=A0ABQ5VAE7_9PROT|nr:hypothetical protein [Algimonas ampicilliniresistens]GLQ23541.1 hypothetical protein GCM10007853_14150 [Algimonas ampicilliniresistens]
MDDFVTAWDELPLGSFDGLFQGRRYGVTRTERDGGRQSWLWAEELGGSDHISANFYRLKSGPLLKPCEMPAAKVIAFVLNIEPILLREP